VCSIARSRSGSSSFTALARTTDTGEVPNNGQLSHPQDLNAPLSIAAKTQHTEEPSPHPRGFRTLARSLVRRERQRLHLEDGGFDHPSWSLLTTNNECQALALSDVGPRRKSRRSCACSPFPVQLSVVVSQSREVPNDQARHVRNHCPMRFERSWILFKSRESEQV
jgi:hypothetical protein